MSLTRRGAKVLGILSFFSLGLVIFVNQQFASHLPPLYQSVRAEEQSLSHYEEYQHQNVKYFYSANHARNSGWGNVMQDFVMMALLAHTTNRSFVFNDYVVNEDGSLYSEYDGQKVPSRIPLSALLSGPIVGGRWPPGDNTPLSVSKEFFHKVCPNPTVLQVSDINTDDMRFNDDIPIVQVFEKWMETINLIDDPCIMLSSNSNPIVEYWIFGEKRLLSIWPYLGKSPVSTHWGWSSLIQDAYQRNSHLFETSKPRFLEWLFYPRNKPIPVSIPGLLAIHVRRGDFKDHCVHLATWSSDWNAFNSFPEFPDKLERVTDAEENNQLYMRRCYPSIEEIVEKVRQVRVEATDPLRYLYIMTNGAAPWVDDLKFALVQDMGWDHISSSKDLSLRWEQRFVSQALDMAVAQHAQVFIGNGWSSFTSNVMMLRVAQGLKAETNRFW